MTQPPDWREVQKRRQLATTGLTETLDLSQKEENIYIGNWLPITTLALHHSHSYFHVGDAITSTTESSRFQYRQSLPPIDFTNITSVIFHEQQSIQSTKKYDTLADHARTIDPAKPAVITYGTGESFWQALGAFEIADRDYIVFPEALSGRWTVGVPDLTCLRLGTIHEILADVGVVPGGAPLQEIELRAKYDEYEPKTVEVDDIVGVAEAKRDSSTSNGIRELASHRGRNKSAYLDGRAVEQGWIVSPNAEIAIHSQREEIGGVTWSDEGAVYFEPPRQEARTDERGKATQTAKRLVLDVVLRHQELPDSLDTTIETCLSDPEHLYSIFDE